MKKIVLFINFLLLFNLSVFAQSKEDKTKEKPKFDGVWILDEDKSFPDKLERKNYENYFLIISLIGNELKINKNYDFKKENTNYNLILFVDNRGEKNIVPLSKDKDIEVTSKTFWQKDSVIRKSAFKTDDVNKSSNRVIEKFRLSKDGNKLIVNVSQSFESNSMPSIFSSPVLGNTRYELVFRRKD